LQEHNNGEEKFTKRYMPWTLVYYEAYNMGKLARPREPRLKHDGNALRELKKRVGLPSTTFKLFKSGAGFTLIELIVSISIIAMMSSLFLTNYHSTNKRSELIMTAQKLASDIRLAQNYSLGSKEYGGNMPTGGWGAHFDKISLPNSYIIFADVDGDKQYDSGEADIDKGGQTISLPAGVRIEDINTGSSLDSIDITFLPPDPTTNIWDGSNNYNLADITLLENTNNTTKKVEVNFFGLVEEKE
jgi:prepilin-type N-terminal cleavage/methylation domain-containing protein